MASGSDHLISSIVSVFSTFGPPVSNLWTDPRTAPFASIIIAPSLFGLVAGLILNHMHQGRSIIKKLALGLLTAATSMTVAVLVIWYATRQEVSASVLVPMLAGMVAAAIAWITGLWLYDFRDLLVCPDAAEEQPTNRAQPRSAAA